MPTAIIYADKDAQLNQGSPATPDANYDSTSYQPSVYANMWTPVYGHGGNNTMNDADVVIGFPANGIPGSAIISSAVVSLKTGNYNAGATIKFAAIPDFNEASAKWNDYVHGTGDKTQSTYVPGHGAIASAVTPTFNTFFGVSIPVGYITPGASRAFLIYSDGETPNYSAEKSSSTQTAFFPTEDVTPANRPYLTITYASAPGAPGSITTPVAGETYDALINLFAGQATDPDTPQASLQYEWSYSADGGATWAVIAGLTAAGTTAKAWNTSGLAQGSNYKVRVRSYDGSAYGPYTTMAGVFSIFHTSRVKIWNGATWVLKNLSRWNGAAWVGTKLKRWDGTQWIQE